MVLRCTTALRTTECWALLCKAVCAWSPPLSVLGSLPQNAGFVLWLRVCEHKAFYGQGPNRCWGTAEPTGSASLCSLLGAEIHCICCLFLPLLSFSVPPVIDAPVPLPPQKKKTTTIAVEVKKSQHKYVIGPKGNSLQEILEKTGVSVEIPPTDSSSETVILRGEPEKLGQALTEVYAKVPMRWAGSHGLESHIGIYVGAAWTSGGGVVFVGLLEMLLRLTQYWGYNIEIGTEFLWRLLLVHPSKQLFKFSVFQANSFTVSSVSAPSWLHRFIIGKKGQNLAKITQQMPKVSWLAFAPPVEYGYSRSLCIGEKCVLEWVEPKRKRHRL